MTDCKCSPYVNSVFEQPWWLDIVAPGQWDEYVVERNNVVEARWPIVHRGNKAYMPRETQNIGPWIRNVPDESVSERLSREKSVLGELIDKVDLAYWDYRLSSTIEYVLPFIWRGFQVRPMFTYVISDLDNMDAIESAFSKTAKKNLKRADKSVEIVDDPDVSVLIDCMEATFRGQSRTLPVSDSLIEAIVGESCARQAGKLLAARDQSGNYHACSFFLFDSNRCYYLLSGSNPEFRTSGAQTLILRDAIRFASGHSRVFDFEGSMVEGIEKFFRQFGGVPQQYYRISRLAPLDVIKDAVKPIAKKALGYK